MIELACTDVVCGVSLFVHNVCDTHWRFTRLIHTWRREHLRRRMRKLTHDVLILPNPLERALVQCLRMRLLYHHKTLLDGK